MHAKFGSVLRRCALPLLLMAAGCQSARQYQSVLDDNPINPGDTLLVNSSASTDPFASRWVVDSFGNVRLPYSGPWRVAGKRPSEVARELSRYFSVRRSVTFKIEKIDSQTDKKHPQLPPVSSSAKKPSLPSPKAAEKEPNPDRSGVSMNEAGAAG